MSGLASDTVAVWLGETLLMTGLLVVLVLLLRGLVARHFGPRQAYALWAIPAARMLLPPLPTWPSETVAAAPMVAPVAGPGVVVMDGGGAAVPAPDLWSILPAWWPLALLLIWMSGVAVELVRQRLAYRRLMQGLAQAETSGWIGRVRVLVSDAVDGPLSFGLLNPVIVLPDPDRLALSDAERDLAIAHELSHHRRGDLWANLAATLFAALHWFNPLVRHAWHAFRFDQESACDATVLARADGVTRGTYARALAKAASGRTAIFSPPMLASPMLGAEKLKERVSMLAQPSRSPIRRGIGLTVSALLLVGAMAATATTFQVAAQEPPAPPAPPAAPQPPEPMATLDMIDMTAAEGEHVTRIERNGATIILRTDHALSPAEVDQMVTEAEASRTDAERAAGDAEHASADVHRQVHTILIRRHEGAETVAVAPVPPVPPVPPAPPVPAVPGERHIVIRSTAGHGPVRELQGCQAGTMPVVNIDRRSGEAGNVNRVRILNCVSGEPTAAQRLAAMRQARESLATSSREIPGEAREAALSELDRQIAVLEREAR